MSELSSTSWKNETTSLWGKTISLTRAICVHHIFVVHYLMKMLETPKFVGFGKKKKKKGKKRDDIRIQIQEEYW
jgi:hypothetical protein